MKLLCNSYISLIYLSLNKESTYKVVDAHDKPRQRMEVNLPTCFQEQEVLRCRKFSRSTFTTVGTYKSTQINGLSIIVAMSTMTFFSPCYSSFLFSREDTSYRSENPIVIGFFVEMYRVQISKISYSFFVRNFINHKLTVAILFVTVFL